MTPKYSLLDPQLVVYAEEAKDYFSSAYGISKSRFKIEDSVKAGIGYRPTMHVVTPEKSVLCIEVVASYTESLDGFVLDCLNTGFPVELHLAVPIDSGATQKDIARAAKSSIGILQVGGASPVVIRGAVSLSLASVGRPDPMKYPKKYRAAVTKSLQTFLETDPAAGTAGLYQEIEDVTRKLAVEANKRSFWRALPTGQTAPNLNWAKDPWQNVGEALVKHLDLPKLRTLGCSVTMPMLGRILGLPDLRNLVGHKPKTLAARIQRDSKIRTRFEHAAEALRELL